MPASVAVPALTAVLIHLDSLVDSHGEWAEGARQGLERLNTQKVPCGWLDNAPERVSGARTHKIPTWLVACQSNREHAAWPSPQGCWQALIKLGAQRLGGCVLVSSDPLLLQAGLAAGLWTVGLASSGASDGLTTTQWLALDGHARDLRRSKVTLQMYALGVHSVIDNLHELASCLDDVVLREAKGEKP
jgi:beta-phosphoglucomutase-like phosphatase (HAD superfamily)